MALPFYSLSLSLGASKVLWGRSYQKFPKLVVGSSFLGDPSRRPIFNFSICAAEASTGGLFSGSNSQHSKCHRGSLGFSSLLLSLRFFQRGRVRSSLLRSLALMVWLFICCVTLDKLHNLPEPELAGCKMESIKIYQVVGREQACGHWGKEKLGQIERVAWKHVYYHI